MPGKNEIEAKSRYGNQRDGSTNVSRIILNPISGSCKAAFGLGLA
jgi:hypothetical protein